MPAGPSQEKETAQLAQELFRSAAAYKPSIFEPRDWVGKMIEWSLEDEALRVALFRFVDVLPSLESAAEVGRHLEEYFAKVDHAFGDLVYLAQALHAGWLVAPIVRHNVTRLARRFIVEEDPDSLRQVLEGLRQEPVSFTLDVVGEATVSDREALAMQKRYLTLLETLTSMAAGWPTVPQIEQGSSGPLPKVSLSVKVSSLYPRFDPLDPECAEVACARLIPLFRKAAEVNAALTVDMEQYAYKDLTLAIFRRLLAASEFASAPQAAIALQAYLRDTEQDVRDLINWARARKRRIGVRLVKGAYWDSEIAWARQKGWPVPVFLDKAETDANYERLTQILLESYDIVDTAFASHNIRSLAHAIVCARNLGLGTRDYEVQMLYGMGEPIRRAVIQSGQRVRVYLPVGKLLPGMAYLIRRLMENTSNTSFLRQTYADQQDIGELIAAPRPRRVAVTEPAAPPHSESDRPEAFRNEAQLDFSLRRNREWFAAALASARSQFGRSYPLWIDGEEVITGNWLESANPAAPQETVGRVALAGSAQAERALETAAAFVPRWRATPARERVAAALRGAAALRRRRVELAAWMVLEAGKPWYEADAEVAEAIDYFEYYGREMLRLGETRLTQSIPGERNLYLYEPRGVAVIIAPWNFPLALLTGMTVAALVTGNCVIAKPAEQSPVVGSLLFEILREAGFPPGASQLLHGAGDLGASLVRDPRVHLIAFTGSRDVGLEILRAASEVRPGQEHVKRVVCEMGGKNAVIVDGDADLDEAVVGIVDSAFGYQGQKCSAAARVILVEEIHDYLVERLVEAVRSLKIGPPEDPRHFIGPLIDAAARAKVKEYIHVGKREGKCLIERDEPPEGYYVGPVVFSGILPYHRLAREEIFGPVLAVMKARDFDHALELAADSPYALTGGVYSRSPAHIDKARREFRVGNLYINRGITGAIIERQPFGGFKLSGIGSKAGGPDYLLQFLEPRTISENTLRHGFVPPEELEPS